MNERRPTFTPHRSFWSHPLLLAALSCQYFVLSIGVAGGLAILVGRDGLAAQPPKFGWQFTAVFLGSLIVATALHFYLLYKIKDPDFWPRGAKAWRNVVGPSFFLLVMLLFPLAQQPVGLATALLFSGMAACMMIALVPTMLCLADYTRSFARRIEEQVALQRVNFSDLPSTVRAYMEQHTSDLVQLGFQPLGDFRLKRHTPAFARFFLNPERDTFAEISCTKVFFLPLRAVGYISLTPGGYYLETSNLRAPRRRQPIRDFEMQGFPGLGNDGVYRRHRDRLRELDGGSPRHLTAEDLEPLILLGNKRLYKLLIAEGRATNNPYADLDESVLLAEGQHPWERDLHVSLPAYNTAEPAAPVS